LWGLDFVTILEDANDKEHPFLGISLCKSKAFEFYTDESGKNIYAVRYKPGSNLVYRWELTSDPSKLSNRCSRYI
jgi:hypothetical protein